MWQLSAGGEMYDKPRYAPADCECADCRDYRLWRVEGTGEWDPAAERRDAPASPVEPAVAADLVADWRTTDSSSTW